jgi:hypothetical protein
LRPAIRTELLSLGILRMTLWTLGGHCLSVLSGVVKGYQGMGGLVK